MMGEIIVGDVHNMFGHLNTLLNKNQGIKVEQNIIYRTHKQFI